jgi:hypothetical protein
MIQSLPRAAGFYATTNSESCARPCGSERASGSIIDGPGQEGAIAGRPALRRTQPAAYLKILALMVPREHKVEHRNPVKDMTDEELEAAIEFIQMMLATQAEKAKVIDGTTAVLPAPAEFEQPRRKRRNRLLEHADTAIGPSRKPQ